MIKIIVIAFLNSRILLGGESGLRGCGGAGFPTGQKWRHVANAAETTKYVVCNADESEPGAFKDRVLMEGDPHRVIEGMLIAAYAVGASQGIIYVRGEYERSARLLNNAIDDARSEGWLGERIQGSRFSFDIELHQVAGCLVRAELLGELEVEHAEEARVDQQPRLAGERGVGVERQRGERRGFGQGVGVDLGLQADPSRSSDFTSTPR